MARYVLRRLVYMVLTLWVIVTLTFVVMHSIPGDPFLSTKRTTPAIRANLMAKYGLDRPRHEQYLIYMQNLLRGDLGISMQYQQRTVSEVIGAGFPVSASLGLRALAYAVPAGLFLGVVAALRRGRVWDYAAMIIAVIGVSVPSFVIGTLLQYTVAVRLGWLPVAGWGTWDRAVLPAFALGLGALAVSARLMRASMLDVLNQDYVKTARAKGLSEAEVVWRHTLRNAFLPLVTVLGPLVVAVITGTLVIEQVFAIPGLGRFFVQSIINQDYTMILGTTVFYAALLVISFFVVDLLYGVVDPRIRLYRGRE